MFFRGIQYRYVPDVLMFYRAVLVSGCCRYCICQLHRCTTRSSPKFFDWHDQKTSSFNRFILLKAATWPPHECHNTTVAIYFVFHGNNEGILGIVFSLLWLAWVAVILEALTFGIGLLNCRW